MKKTNFKKQTKRTTIENLNVILNGLLIAFILLVGAYWFFPIKGSIPFSFMKQIGNLMLILLILKTILLIMKGVEPVIFLNWAIFIFIGSVASVTLLSEPTFSAIATQIEMEKLKKPITELEARKESTKERKEMGKSLLSDLKNIEKKYKKYGLNTDEVEKRIKKVKKEYGLK